MSFPDWLKRNASTILTGLGAGGFIFTVVEAVRATPKAMKKLEEKNPRTLKEKISTAAPCYISTAVTGLASLGCIIGANVVGRKENEALTAMLIPLQAGLDNYKDKVERIIGPQARIAVDESIKDDIIDATRHEVRTYYYECKTFKTGIFFDATGEELDSFKYEINRKFAIEGFITEAELIEFMPVDQQRSDVIAVKKRMDELLDEEPPFGWDKYIDEIVYNSKWIDVKPNKIVMDDGYEAVELQFQVPAHPLDEQTWIS